MLKIYGASDDLIEFEGDFHGEVCITDCSDKVLAFSDGSLIGVEYTKDGIWRFDIRESGPASPVRTFTATNSDGDNYSDVILFQGFVKWAIFGTKAD